MKILVVDDHPLIRRGISSTLSFEDNIGTIQEASNPEEAIEILKADEFTLAIVDLNLGNRDGLEIVSKARKLGIKTKFLILTSSIRKEDFFRAKEIGVNGYILKEAFAEDILYAIHVVLRGREYVDPEIIRYQASNNIDSNLDELTPRENDVLMVLSKGYSNYEIGKELFISENTVKKHVSNILSKLELNHRTQAALLMRSTANF